MQYVKVTFATASQEQSDMLVALLAGAGYDGFEEQGNYLFAYIERPEFHAEYPLFVKRKNANDVVRASHQPE